MALVGPRERGYRIRMVLYRFLFAPVLLAVAVLAGTKEERRPVRPPAAEIRRAPPAPSRETLRVVPGGGERAPARPSRPAR